METPTEQDLGFDLGRAAAQQCWGETAHVAMMARFDFAKRHLELSHTSYAKGLAWEEADEARYRVLKERMRGTNGYNALAVLRLLHHGINPWHEDLSEASWVNLTIGALAYVFEARVVADNLLAERNAA